MGFAVATNTILAQTHQNYDTELTAKSSLIAAQHADLKTLAAEFDAERAKLNALQRREKDRQDRQSKIQNHRRASDERRFRIDRLKRDAASLPEVTELKPEEMAIDSDLLDDPDSVKDRLSNIEALNILKSLPADAELSSLQSAHATSNDRLEELLGGLRQRSSELEGKYRKVVAMCTSVPEDEVDGMLGALLAAVASERGEGTDVTKVREFLRKVDSAAT